MNHPKVSVITPLYNCEKYIALAIQSIIAQTFTDWELIICDDGSTDRSYEIAAAFAATDNRIRLISNEINKGTVFTYNRLFSEAHGVYIAIQDADDWSDPKRLSKQVSLLNEKDIGICLTGSNNYSEEGRLAKSTLSDSCLLNKYLDERIAWPATMMFKRSVLKEVKGFHTYFSGSPAFDWYFVLNVIHRFGGFFLSDRCYNVLVRPLSDHRSINFRDPAQIRKLIIFDVYLFLKRQLQSEGKDWLQSGRENDLLNYEQSLMRNPKFLSEKLRIFSCYKVEHNSYLESIKALGHAISLNPWTISNYRTAFYLFRHRVKNIIANVK